MTTPGSHNDAYASTCHRMFFANRMRGKPLDQCPDNDHHNVDTMDGLVLPCVVALGSVGRDVADSDMAVVECARATRKSESLEKYSTALASAVRAVVADSASLGEAMQTAARQLGIRLNVDSARRMADPITA